MIIAKTIKGKGISFLEDKDGWHGKALNKEQLEDALKELGDVDLKVRGKIQPPQIKNQELTINNEVSNLKSLISKIKNKKMLHVTSYALHDLISTREAFGAALTDLGEQYDNLVVLDAEVANSTYEDKFAKQFPERFFEMYIAEQNMVSAALGMSKVGYKVFASSFSAFLTRAFDQIRMAQYSDADLNIVGSHAGVSIGKDGPSQMGLEDFAMMRSILDSIVLCGSDAVSAFKLTEQMYQHKGINYLRTMRDKFPVIYNKDEEFKIGGSKILRQSPEDKAVIFATGITVHEALKAYELLLKEQISVCVVDLYSIKPIDIKTIQQLTISNMNIIVVEDHYPCGGLGEAVSAALGQLEIRSIRNFIHLCVRKLPRSGTSEELLSYEEIDSKAIIKKVKELVSH